MKKKEITPPLKYFFKKLEKKSNEIQATGLDSVDHREEIEFDDVERFVRALMSQNIFIHSVGLNGKHESTIMSKAAYSINKVVRIYYSTSLDQSRQGYIRIYPSFQAQKILIERMHGYRPAPELLYTSKNQCHVVRFITMWLLKRIDWSKTKLSNIELYKAFVQEEKRLIALRLEEEQAMMEAEALQETLDKHFGKDAQRIMDKDEVSSETN